MDRFHRVRRKVEKAIWTARKEERITRKQASEEFAHLHGVILFSRLLAERRGLCAETAGIIGALHDYARLAEGEEGRRHAGRGARLAGKLLGESGQFSPEEIRVIQQAIESHDAKGRVDPEAYRELIKDADLLARYYETPDARWSRPKIHRLNRLRAELGADPGHARGRQE